MMAAHQKQNMRDHLQAVQELTASLATGDFVGVKHAAERLGSSQQMTRMCEHMGAHAPGFTETALSFHKTADTLSSAAEHQDRDAVLAALTRTLAACTGCHSTYKQQVIDEETWAALSTTRR
jgi:cytochrome c556